MTAKAAYNEDLAYIHDAGFGAMARDAAARLIDELRTAGFAAGAVVDFGCGSGILAEQVSHAGFTVTGIDVSEAMIAIARTRVPSAEFCVGSFVSADLPDCCCAVTAIGEVLNYTFDGRNDTAARGAFFARVHRSLAPGGLFIFDMNTLDRARPGEERRTFAEGNGWAVMAKITVDAQTRILTREIVSFRQVGELYRRDSETHRLALVDSDDVARALDAAGFETRRASTYGDHVLPPGVTVFIARKRRDHLASRSVTAANNVSGSIQ